ncbi:MAG: hypothetical protein IPJ76_15790 [Flavobacteriales bacterium]|nr:MAG: hypothetical protein IPJ76_15790 [Flavobacteriales bacterium]
MGTTLIGIGIYWGSVGNNDYHLILTTIGGALLGSSAGWMIEEYYRKGDERTDALSLFNKTYDLLQRHVRVNSLFPHESAVQDLRTVPLHFYYSTFTENGEPFWNYVVLDFTQVVVLGRLLTRIKILDYQSEPHDYDVELYRLQQNDPILILWRPSNSAQAAEVTLLASGFVSYQKWCCGLIDHEDWGRQRRLSRAILSKEKLISNISPGPLSEEDGNKLQNRWEFRYQRGYDLFRSSLK